MLLIDFLLYFGIILLSSITSIVRHKVLYYLGKNEGDAMDKTDLKFEIPCDSDGYAAFSCPFCCGEFKLSANEIQNDELSYDSIFCPYCGLNDIKSNFLPKEALEHAQALAENYIIEQLNNTFGGMAKKLNKSKYIKSKFTPVKKVEVKGLRAQDTSEEIFKCGICENHVKTDYSFGASKIFCVYCGVDL